jgi:hypothetical protein
LKIRFLLLFALLVASWVISLKYNVDLKVLHAVASWLSTDLTRVYGENGSSGRFFYGPVTLLFIVPFAELTYFQTQIYWGIIQTCAFLILFWGVSRSYPELWRGPFARWLLFFLFAINPIHNNFQSGNIQLILLSTLWVAEEWGNKGTKGLRCIAGIMAAVLMAIKIFPVFLIPYYLITKDRRFFLGLFLGGFLSVILPFVFFGYAGGELLFREFWNNLFSYQRDNSLLHTPDILCLPSLLSRLHVSDILIKGILLAVAAGFYLWLWLKKRAGTCSAQYREEWALALLFMTLLNPSTRVHYFVFYLPAFASLVETSLVLSALVFALIGLTMEGVVGKRWNDFLEYQNFPTWGAILLGLALMKRPHK